MHLKAQLPAAVAAALFAAAPVLAGQIQPEKVPVPGEMTHQPGIGRPVEGGLRELIISRKRSGYLARYEFDQARDLVLVARIRHQRESGYSEGEI